MTAVSSRAVQTRRLHLCLEWSGEVYPCPHLWQLRSRPSLRFQGHGPIVKWLPALARAERLPGASRHWSSPRVLATSVPACCVAPDHRPSLDLGQSRHMASAFAVAGWLPNAASARPTPRILGPGDRSAWGAPRLPVSSGALARPVHLPDCRPPRPGVGPDGRSGRDIPCPQASSGTLARPVYQPTLGLSAGVLAAAVEAFIT